MRSVLMVVASATSLTSMWSAVRVSGVQVSDALLLLWSVLVVLAAGPAALRRTPRWLAAPVLAACLAMTLQVLVGASTAARLSADSEVLLRLVTATVVVPLVIIASARVCGTRALRVIVQGWVASAAVSVLAELYVVRGGTLPSVVVRELVSAERGFGLALHPNSLGMTCVLALPFFLGGMRGHGPIPARLAVPGSGLMLVGLFVADSRAALLVGGVIVLLAGAYLCTTRGAWPIGLPLLLLAMAAALVYLPDVVAGTRLSGSGNTAGSDALRELHRQQALELIEASPVFGHQLSSVGAGVMTLLGLLVAGGIVFAVGYYAYFGAALRVLLPLARQGRALATLCIISTTCFLTIGLAQPSTVERYTFWPIGVGLALALVARPTDAVSASRHGARTDTGRTGVARVSNR